MASMQPSPPQDPNVGPWIRKYLSALLADPVLQPAPTGTLPVFLEQQIDPALERGQSTGGRLTIQHVVGRSPAMVLLGPSGSGKSTLLRQLVRELAQEASTNPHALLPLYVPLTFFDGSIEGTLAAQARMRGPALSALALVRPCILIVDALNDLPPVDQIPVLGAIRRALHSLEPHGRWIIACRSEAWGLFDAWLPANRFQVWRIRPWNDQTILSAVQRQGTPAGERLLGLPGAIDLARRPRWLGAFLQLRDDLLPGPMLMKWIAAAAGEAARTHCLSDQCAEVAITLLDDLGAMLDRYPTLTHATIQTVIADAAAAVGLPAGEVHALLEALALLHPAGDDEWAFRSPLLGDLKNARDLHEEFMESISGEASESGDETQGALLAKAIRPTPLALLYGMVPSPQPLLKSLIRTGAWEATQHVLDANLDTDGALASLEETGLVDSAVGAALGRAWAQGGSPDVAVALLEWTVRQGRDDPYLFGLLGHLYRQAGHWSEARKAFEEALRRDPANLDYQQALAQVCAELGEADAATTTLEGVLAAQHNRLAAAAFQLGALREEQGKLTEALDHYSRAAALYNPAGVRPGSSEAGRYLLAKARVLRRLGRNEEAKEILRSIDPDSVDAIALADENAALLEATGNNRAAIQRLTEIEAYGSATATTYLRMAELQRRQNDLAEAERAYRSAAEVDPHCEAAYEGLADLAAATGDFGTAVSAYERLVDLRGNDAETWRRLGAYQRQDGRLSESNRSLQTALRLDPASSETQIEIARTRWAQGDQATALSYYRSAAANDPDGRISAEAGWALLESGDLPAAQAMLERAAGLRPADGRVLYDLGRCFEAQGATKRALEWFMQAAHVAPSASTLRATGRVARILGEYAMARQMLARALRADRNNGDTAAEIGRLHLQEHRPDLAAVALRRAMAKGVNDIETQRDLAEALLQLKDAQGALAILEPITVDDNDFHNKRSRAYELLGDPQAALNIVRAAAARQPRNATLQHRVGTLALRAGLPSEALVALEAARALGDKEPSTLIDLSRAMLLTGRTNAALRPVDEALQRMASGTGYPSSDEIGVQIQRGETLLALEDWAEARRAFERALEVYDQLARGVGGEGKREANPQSTALSTQVIAEAWAGLAEAYSHVAGAGAALPYARHALELAPGTGDFVRLIGRLLLEAGDLNAAREVLGSDPKAEPATLRLRLQVEMADGHWAEAAALAARCHTIDPHDLQVAADYGAALLHAGQPEEALPLLESVCAVPTAAPEWSANLGRCYLKLGNAEAAIQAFNRSLEARPDAAETHADLASAYMAQGAYGSAVHALRQALELGGERVDWRTALARAYGAQGWYTEALGEWERARALAPHDLSLRLEVAQAHLELGHPEAALADLEALTAENPQNYEGWKLLSRAALDANNPARAVYAAACALSERPDDPRLRVLLAEAALAARDPQRAFDALIPLVQSEEQGEKNIKALLLVHQAANQLGNPAAARSALEHAGRMAPGDPEVQLAIADHLQATGDKERSLKLLRNLYVRSTNSAPIAAKIAQQALKAGDLELARQAAERATTLSPQDPAYARLFGHICFEAGDHNSARRALQLAMKGRQDPETALILGKLALQRGEATEATRLLRLAHEHRSDDPEAAGWLALALRHPFEPVFEDEPPEPQTAPALDAAVLLLREAESVAQWRAELGWTLVLRGEHADAIAMLSSAARSERLSPEQRVAALRRVGLVLLALGRAGDAMAPLERAHALAPTDATIVSLLGQSTAVHSTLHAAIQYYERAVALEPDNGRHHLRLGLGLLGSGETEAALEHLSRATELEPARAAAWTAFSKGLLATREVDRALTAAHRAVQLAPADGRTWRQFAAAQEAHGDIPAALDSLERAVANAPGGPTGTPQAKEWLIHYANLAIAHGEPVRGRTALQSASDLDPNDADLLYQLAQLHGPAERIALLLRAVELRPSCAAWRTQLADLLAARGEHRPALDHLEQAIEAEPDNVHHWLALARAYRQTGDDATAEEVLRRAEANCEPDAELHTALGDLLASQSRWAEALQSYIEAAGLKQAAGASGKEIADCHADCGFCLQALGRLDQAQEVLELALNHDPVHPKAATYLAQVHMLRDPEEGWKNAIRYARIATQNAPTEIVGYKLQARAALRGKWTHEFKTALEHAYAIAPDDPELHELQGWYYFQEGKLEIALAEAEQAIEHDPQSATGYHLLAEILKSQKRWTEAMAALRTAVRLDGNYTGAIKALTSIGLEALMHGNRR